MEQWGISEADVASAAEQIIARGERASLRAVRNELGRGSLTTIAPFLAIWRKRASAISVNLTFPTGLQRLILGEMEQQIAAARAELQAEIAEIAADRDVLADEAERQAAALKLSEARILEQSSELERRGGVIAQLERVHAALSDQLSREREAGESARRNEALAALRLESLPDLHAQLGTLRKKLDDEREARRLAEIEAAELRGKKAVSE